MCIRSSLFLIQNEKQYSVTRSQKARLEAVLKMACKSKKSAHPELYQGMVAGLRSQMDDMNREIREYEACRRASSIRLSGISSLSMLLTQARIARGYTQKDLAERLHLNPQQIQRYEATQYRSASLKRIQDIMQTLQVDIHAKVPLKHKDETPTVRRRSSALSRHE